MKTLLLTLLVLLGGSALALFVHKDPGYVLVGYQNYTVEMSLMLFALTLVLLVTLLYFSMRLISGVRSSPRRLKKWRSQRNQLKAHDTLNKGLIASAEGQWKKAEKNLLAYVKGSDNPRPAYLAAAKAAQAQGANERRDYYLNLAHQHADAHDDVAVEVMKAELQMDNGQWEEALASLVRLRRMYPKNNHVLRLLAGVYEQLQDWTALSELLSDLQKRQVFHAQRLNDLQHRTYRGRLESANKMDDVAVLHAAWNSFPKNWREDSAMLGLYLRFIIARGEMATAEPLLRAALKRHWNEDLVYMFGLLNVPNAAQALSWMEKTFYSAYENNPVLLLTLGRLSMQAQLWGKARTYLEAAVERGGEPEVYFNLATLLEKVDETEAARECYRKGLSAATKQRETLALKA